MRETSLVWLASNAYDKLGTRMKVTGLGCRDTWMIQRVGGWMGLGQGLSNPLSISSRLDICGFRDGKTEPVNRKTSTTLKGL